MWSHPRQRRAATLLIVFALALAAALSGPAAPAARAAPAAPGELDPTFAGFSGDGVVSSPFEVSDLAIRPDGKIVVVGGANVARYLTNGVLDATFDGDGRAAVPGNFFALTVALQGDGRIVVGGRRLNDNGFYVARLLPDGSPDHAFDGDGAFRDEDESLHELKSVLVQPDGKVVACGTAYFGGDRDFAVTRYTVGGLRDTTFGGGDGKVTVPFGELDHCGDLALLPDGRIAAAGTRIYDAAIGSFGDNDLALARLLKAGEPDPDFDNDGKLTLGLGGDEYGRAVVVQPDFKLVVLGYRYDTKESFLVRYLTTGTLDGTFGSGGKVIIPADDLTALALQTDGKLVVAGFHTSPGGDTQLSVRRLLANGSPDESFDFDGTAWLDFGGDDRALALAVQPDGRLLAGGRGGGTGLLARLWPDGTFDAHGKQTQAVSSGVMFPPGSAVRYAYLAVAGDGGLLAAGEVVQKDGGNRTAAFLTRFNASGQPDTAFGAQGLRLLTSGLRNGARAALVQPDGKIVIAGYSDWGDPWPSDFMVARYSASGAPDIGFGGSNLHDRHINFASGYDVANAIALAPDGKIVVVGEAWNGSHTVWGVARLNKDGSPDLSFGQGGKAYVDFGDGSAAYAVVVQPDGKIVVGGMTSGRDFALARLLDNGLPDQGFGTGGGAIVTDMGGQDSIAALALGADGMLYAGGYSWRGGQDDYALAQYTPAGQLATCPAGEPCPHWPTGKRYVNIGASDSAYALALRDDGQLLAAGCTDYQLSAAQVSTTDAEAEPLVFTTSFAGSFSCAFSAAFTGAADHQIIAAGPQYFGANGNLALARFETTPGGPLAEPDPFRLYLPFVTR